MTAQDLKERLLAGEIPLSEYLGSTCETEEEAHKVLAELEAECRARMTPEELHELREGILLDKERELSAYLRSQGVNVVTTPEEFEAAANNLLDEIEAERKAEEALTSAGVVTGR
jgi:hypothetical protein